MSVEPADLKAVAMSKDGTVHVHHDGVLHNLGRPRWGQYRRLRDEFKDLAPIDRERIALATTAQNAEGGEQADAVERLLDLTDQLSERKALILTLIFNGHPGQDGRPANPDSGDPGQPAIAPFKGLADVPLPADPDSWETWLLADEELLPKLMEHWRQVPLVRGAPASG